MKYSEPNNVLLVEDEELNKIYFEELLNNENLNCTIVSTLKEAKEIINEENFLFIISDYKLKDGNGIDLFFYATNNGYNKSKFLLITGYSEDEIKSNHAELVLPDMLQKPVSNKLFSEKINKILAQNNYAIDSNKTEQKQYDYSKITEILKGDADRIEKSVNEFIAILEKTNDEIIITKQTKNIETLRKSFHDLLNLAVYYGGSHLYEEVRRYRDRKEFDEKMIILETIHNEVNSMLTFFKKNNN